MDLLETYLARAAGSRLGAGYLFALDLARGDKDTHKAGYTPENAALAAGEFFGLAETEKAIIGDATAPDVGPGLETVALAQMNATESTVLAAQILATAGPEVSEVRFVLFWESDRGRPYHQAEDLSFFDDAGHPLEADDDQVHAVSDAIASASITAVEGLSGPGYEFVASRAEIAAREGSPDELVTLASGAVGWTRAELYTDGHHLYELMPVRRGRTSRP